MRCKDILKLASICAATLSLVLTMKGIAQEEREADHLDMVADIEAETPEAPAEPEPTETPEPVIYAHTGRGNQGAGTCRDAGCRRRGNFTETCHVGGRG